MKYCIESIGKEQYVSDGEFEWPAGDVEIQFWARIQDLEYCLAEIYHHTSCTTYQMELINKILPQE